MGLGYILLLGFGGYAALQFYRNQKAIEKDLRNRQIAQPGVSYYQTIAVPSRPDKVLAFTTGRPTGATQDAVYAAPLGPDENQNCACFNPLLP